MELPPVDRASPQLEVYYAQTATSPAMVAVSRLAVVICRFFASQRIVMYLSLGMRKWIPSNMRGLR